MLIKQSLTGVTSIRMNTKSPLVMLIFVEISTRREESIEDGAITYLSYDFVTFALVCTVVHVFKSVISQGLSTDKYGS